MSMTITHRRIALSAIVLVSCAASAQLPPPKTTAPYRSAFENYKPFGDAPVADWRTTNDTVGRIGGWQTYAREAQAAASSPAAASAASAASRPAATAATSASAPSGHGGHQGHHRP
jgi:hypothetical protein